MSGVSPSRRLQLKTSDLTEFFRGSSSSGGLNAANSAGVSPASSEEQQAEGVSPGKRRSTRIPFMGRTRKKSTHSDKVPFPASTAEPQAHRPSASTSRSRPLLDEQPIPSLPEPRASTSQPSWDIASGPPVQPTFSSKIASHFTSSKSLGLHLPSRKSIRRPVADRPSGDVSDNASDTLSPPSFPLRPPSIDSTSSSGSRHHVHAHRSQSVTPRPDPSRSSRVEPQLSQPRITVSSPPADPYDFGEFDDLFTKPQRKQKPLPITIVSENSRLQLQDQELSNRGSHGVVHISAPASTGDGTSEDATAGSEDSTPTPRAVSQQAMESRDPTTVVDISDSVSLKSKQSVATKRPSVFAAKQQYHRDNLVASEAELESAEESEAVSMKSSKSMPSSSRASRIDAHTRMTLAEKRRTLAAMPYGSRTADASRKLVSLQAPSSKPPSIPLPSPPSPSQPHSPNILTDSRGHSSRPKAHSISPSPTQTLRYSRTSSVISTLSTPAIEFQTSKRSSDSSSSSTQTLTQVFPRVEPLEIDIDTAPPDQLREALHQRNAQYNELVDLFSRTLEAHIAEKNALENQLAHLEREALRRDKEIKGLTWLVTNNKSPGGGVSGISLATHVGSRGAHIMEKEKERSDDSSARSLVTPPPSVRLPLYRRLRVEDSGAEPYLTSTSDWGSGTSGAEESMGESDLHVSRARRTMKKLKLVESANRASPITRPISVRQPGGQTSSPGTEIPFPMSRIIKRSSASSAISSAGTITSSSSISSPSTSPTSLAFPTSPALSAIPEARSPSALSASAREKTTSVSSGSDKEDHTRERRPSRISFHRSKPSPPAESSIPSVKGSSRLTPSEAYAMNLTKGRPPSIAQVLDKTTDVAIEKSYGGGSRALLAGLSAPSSK